MGHLLGAAPPAASATASHLSSAPVPEPVATWVEATGIARHESALRRIAAFAIDTPRVGERTPGSGVEINGWVIGRTAPVRGVRVTSDDFTSRLESLANNRPDVAAVFPGVPWAMRSGFTIWAPVSGSATNASFDVEAQDTNGDFVPLATIVFHSWLERVTLPPDHRPVTAPDFVVIGAQRGGTTSLYTYLSAHPQVTPAAAKELHFLTDRFARGRDWYLSRFPASLPPGAVTGEATPYALFHPLAPQRLRAIAPDALLIVLLRDPVARAYSHYGMERARGDEELDFAAALSAEEERLAGEEFRLIADPGSTSWPHKHYSYQARGDYAPQLERWFEQFPREQFLIVRSEDLYQRTPETFAQVASFLDISPNVRPPFTAHNRGEPGIMDPWDDQRLRAHFAPRNAKLADLLGSPPGWESTAGA